MQSKHSAPLPRLLKVAGILCRFLLLGAMGAASAVSAEPYPDNSKPIKIIVPVGAGSAIDLMARSAAKAMAEESQLNVIVDNKPGAELALGVQAFVSSPPDGYTLLFTTSSSQSLNPVVIPNLRYDPLKDYVPVASLSKTALILNLGTSTGSMSAREFIESAKKNPGKHTCASGSTTQRMACEMLQAAAGIKLLNVPYKSTAAAMIAIAGGEVDAIFVDAGTAKAQWQTGRVRGVAVTGPERMQALPRIPTLREEGVADFNMTAWYAAYAPNKTPPAVLAAIREIVRKSTASKTFADTLAQFAMEPMDLNPEQINDLTRREMQGWTNVVRQQNIKFTN